jgi:hypothetical protein
VHENRAAEARLARAGKGGRRRRRRRRWKGARGWGGRRHGVGEHARVAYQLFQQLLEASVGQLGSSAGSRN